MSTSSAVTDPAEIIAAAVQDLYDQLRQIVDRGPTSDPTLLDELRQLTRRIGGRISRARKRNDKLPELGPPQAPTATESPELRATSTSSANAAAAPTHASGPTAADDGNAHPRAARPAAKPSPAFAVRLLPAPPAEAPIGTGGMGSTRPALRGVRRATRTASFVFWKAGRAVVAGLALALIAVLIGQGMADSGVPAVWVGVWSIGCLVAFVAGLCVWASRAAGRWAPEIDGRVPARDLIGTVPRSSGRHRRPRG